MRKVIYASGLLFSIAMMQSCDKNMEHASKQIAIDTTLASGAEYKLDLQPYGDADDVASITRQGSAFTTSEIVNASGTFAPVYHYAAFTKTGLTDQVVLTVSEGHEGRGHGGSTIITINFTIK